MYAARRDKYGEGEVNKAVIKHEEVRRSEGGSVGREEVHDSACRGMTMVETPSVYRLSCHNSAVPLSSEHAVSS